MSRAIRSDLVGAGVLAALLMSLYVGSYVALLEGKVYRLVGVDPITGQNLFEILPRYHVAPPVVERAFRPIHRIDRALRREFWITIEHSSGAKWSNPPAEQARISN